VLSIQGDNVTLDFDLGAGVSIHSSEDWDRAHAARKAANESRGSDRPMQKAPYSD
jgi:hypothetical protein